MVNYTRINKYRIWKFKVIKKLSNHIHKNDELKTSILGILEEG